MKKIILILCAVFTSAGLVLAEHTLHLNNQVPKNTGKELKTKQVTTPPMKAGIDKVSQLAGKKAISARKADAQNTIEGTWTFTLGDYYFQTSEGSFTYNFEATLEGTELWFEDPTGYELPFVADYDASTGTLTFSETYLGSSS